MRYLAPVLSVRDVAETMRFYTETLGFQEWFAMPGRDGATVFGGVAWGNAYLMIGDQRGLDDAARQRLGAGVEFYVEVGDADLDAYYERVRDRVRVVATIETKYWGDRVFTIADPDGYRVSFAKSVEAVSVDEIAERMRERR